MFIVIYEFIVKEGFEEQFLSAWTKTTQGIYLFRGSLGSRLHREKNGKFIAYAQWPDEATFRNGPNVEMNNEYEKQRKKMNESLNFESTKILCEMEVEIDYLHNSGFNI